MLKKGDNFMHNSGNNKKNRLVSEPSQSYTQFNKENINSKSLFENINENFLMMKNKTQEQSNFGSNVVSPTFQSTNVINLKDDLFKHKGYVQVNMNLKDLNLQNNKEINQLKKGNDKYYELPQDMENRLKQHYENKFYWSKIQKLFKQQGADAVFAWQDAISKYKELKKTLSDHENSLSKLNQQLIDKSNRIIELQKQSLIEKNETKIVSQKKCKGCQSLQQKQKQYYSLFEQHKKSLKQFKELQDQLKLQIQQKKQRSLEEKAIKQEMEKKIYELKQQNEKKNKLLGEKEQIHKQYSTEIKKYKNEERQKEKFHIQIEQVKELNHQLQKKNSKIQQQKEKIEKQKIIYQQELNKIRTQFNQFRLKAQIQMATNISTIELKSKQCEQLKRKHIQILSEEIKKKSDVQDYLRNKQEQLEKAYSLLDQAQGLKVKVQFELKEQRKKSDDMQVKLSRSHQLIKDLQNRLRDVQESQTRIKQINNGFRQIKGKTINNTQNTNNIQLFLKKMSPKVRQVYTSLREINEESSEFSQKRRIRQDDSDQSRQILTLPYCEKLLIQIFNEISTFLNKFFYVHKQNQIITEQMEVERDYKRSQIYDLQKQIKFKEDALKTILYFVPEEHKDLVIDFLQIIETIVQKNDDEQQLYEQLEETKTIIENQSRQWKENNQKMMYRYKKMEEQLKKYEQSFEEQRRKIRTKDIKKTLPTEYDYGKDIVTKKDIRRKYNFDS